MASLKVGSFFWYQAAASFDLTGRVDWGADTVLPTPRTTSGVADLVVTCNTCRHNANADLARLVADGFGDVPLLDLRRVLGRPGARFAGCF